MADPEWNYQKTPTIADLERRCQADAIPPELVNKVILIAQDAMLAHGTQLINTFQENIRG